MERCAATVIWQRDGARFTDNRYSRRHLWSFDGGTQVPASASPQIVPPPMSSAAAVDPEEALVAAASSCHMLWFLSLAAQRGLVVDAYEDHAVGTLERNPAGRMAITRIVLRPTIRFAGDPPAAAEIAALHARAHDECMIANSLRAEVVVAGD